MSHLNTIFKYITLSILILTVFQTTTSSDDFDYYQELGINRRSSTIEIKKAFRKLSVKYHPDRNPNNDEAYQKFLRLNRAYEILSDSEKRNIYNRYGHDGIEQHEKKKAAQGSRRGGIFDFFGGGRHNDDDEEKRGPDIHVDIWLHLHEIYNGRLYDTSIFRQTVCPHCFGSGAETDDHIHDCPRCRGEGTILERRQIGQGFIQQIQNTCPKCHGSGKIITKECHKCHGSGIFEGSHTYWVEIERGVLNNNEILLENEGDENADSVGGHIVFHVKTFENTITGCKFIRDVENVNDLHYWMNINILQALIGYNIDVVHMDGRVLNLNTSEYQEGYVTKPLSVRVISGEGMPIIGTFPIQFGDLNVHFNVMFPEGLSDEQKIGVKELGL